MRGGFHLGTERSDMRVVLGYSTTLCVVKPESHFIERLSIFLDPESYSTNKLTQIYIQMPTIARQRQ